MNVDAMYHRQPTITDFDCKYGAPMGRAAWLPCNAEPKTVRVFEVHINTQGYDRGGAYWGTGGRLYCATDCQDYREFTRAKTREDAIDKLNIDYSLLKVKS